MSEIKIISKNNVSKLVDLLDPKVILELAAKSFYYASKSLAQMPERLTLFSPEHKLLVMPSSIPQQGEIVKLVGIPSSANGLSSATVVLSSGNGLLEWVVNSESITAIRTASGSALITRALCSNLPKVLLIFGSGLQAYWHIKIILKVLSTINKVIVFGRSFSSAEKLTTLVGLEFKDVCFSVGELNNTGQVEKASPELVLALKTADIICSCTPSKLPFIYGSLLKEGAHLNCIGSYTPEMQEFDIEVVRHSTIFIDSEEMASKEAGELIRATKELPNLRLLELGNFITLNESPPPESFMVDVPKIEGELQRRVKKFTLFKSVGIATQDLTLTCQICALAEEFGLYDKVPF